MPIKGKGLERSLSLGMVTAISMSAMLGSGIFVLPSIAAAKAGPAVWLAYLLAAICILPAALSKAELATAMPTSGGSYVYYERTFGPLCGTIAGLGLWLSLILKSSFALVGFGAYLEIVSRGFAIENVSFLMLIAIVFLNVLGVVKVARVQAFIILLSIGALFVIDVFGVRTIDKSLTDPMLPFGIDGLFTATGLVFVSYAGVTKIAAISEEVKDPSRNLPLGMMISLAIVCVLYCCTTYIMVSNISYIELMKTNYPVYVIAETLLGPKAGYFAAVLGILAMASMANSGLLASSRFPFAMSRDHLLPSSLSRIHPKFKTPIVSILGTGLAMGVIVLTLDIYHIAKMASALMIVMFVGINVCVIVLRETKVQWYNPGYKSPFYPWTQLFGIVTGIPLLYLLGGIVFDALLFAIIPGMILYILYGQHKTERQGVLRMYGRRASLLLRASKEHSERQARKRRPSAVHTTISENVGTEAAKPSLDTAVLVPMFGQEGAPEMLVEIGVALANGKNVEVVHLTEAPEQTFLEAIPTHDSNVRALHRRIKTMAERESFSADFDSLVTHDLLTTVDDLADQTTADWIAIEWTGNLSRGLLLHSPVTWLMSHLNDKNLALLKDKNIRYVSRILAHCNKGKDQELIANTSAHLAKTYEAEITYLQFMPLSTSDEALAQAQVALRDQFCKAPRSEALVLRSNKPTEELIKLSPDFDLLVTGSPPRPSTLKVIFTTAKDALTTNAACSVLRLRRPRNNGE